MKKNQVLPKLVAEVQVPEFGRVLREALQPLIANLAPAESQCAQIVTVLGHVQHCHIVAHGSTASVFIPRALSLMKICRRDESIGLQWNGVGISAHQS
jgi:hypothetical protein